MRLFGLSPLLIKHFPQRLAIWSCFASATGSSSVGLSLAYRVFITLPSIPHVQFCLFLSPIRLCCGFLMISLLFNHSGEIGPKIANKSMLMWMGSRPARTTSSNSGALIPSPSHPSWPICGHSVTLQTRRRFYFSDSTHVLSFYAWRGSSVPGSGETGAKASARR